MLALGTQQQALLRALRPLLASLSTVPSAARLFSSSDSDEDSGDQAAALFADLRSQTALLADGQGGQDLQQRLDHLLGEGDSTVPTERQRLLQVGVVGAPNAGKSTLLNALTAFKVWAWPQ
jgi:hypothetical protein